MPLSNLAAWLGGAGSPEGALSAVVRRLLLTVDGEGQVLLYYIDADTGLYYVSRTDPELSARLERLVGSAPQPNGAQFAFEAGEGYSALDPYTMLEGGAAPRPSRYTATDPGPQRERGARVRGGLRGAGEQALLPSPVHVLPLPGQQRGGTGGV